MSDIHHIEVRRTARLATLGEPGPATRTVWLACHGYGQLAARFLRRFEPLVDDARWIVAPEALNRFYLDGKAVPHGPASPVGATWMTREDRLTDIDDYVGYLDSVHDWIFDRVPREQVRLHVLGFSQGMSTVARWAASTEAEVDHLVLWAGSWPPELEPRANLFNGTPLSLVAGTQDESVSEQGMNSLVARLRAGGLEPRLIRYDGAHQIDAATVVRLEGIRNGDTI